ncbi:tRNA (guanosine(37)-N1)-methyltransferase TrmD [Nitrosomonas marina]|uniref:tRNA (guanine-N(1)-)-methyltransferase n=1 Tax=Nitrosomonas marina TaxID=917 RepID=A0A1H8ADS6_9PROT|nr:tRNA (guanosine(37)-N1)-methyltransferase TrmD [Nitrosomonas marina]SEM67697.1 tRNA (Guanine37-N(1)-) methyltransferase [Nitrosomonas marina]
MPYECDVVTLFPEMFDAVTQYGVTGRANRNSIFRLKIWNPRDFSDNSHRTVDDSPYGGGPGMVMMAKPLEEAIISARKRQQMLGIEKTEVIYMTPQGRRLDHREVKRLSLSPGIILLCGRYEGIDERVIHRQVDTEVSIGDYVLSGGELAAMVVIDSVVRLIPGTLGEPESAAQESFVNGLLDYPHYTRPEQYCESSVPDVLLSGNHALIRRWRLQQALGKTWLKRPDLLKLKEKKGITEEEKTLLEEFKKNCKIK